MLNVLSKPGNYTRQHTQFVKGMCAHQKFEKSNLGGRVKYGKSGAAAVPDGTKYVLKELKPDLAQARGAANRTARITGIVTYGYVWEHLGQDRFNFKQVVVSNTGTNKYRISTSPRFKFGPIPPIGVGAGAPWQLLGEPTGTEVIQANTDDFLMAATTSSEVTNFVIEILLGASDLHLAEKAWGVPSGPVDEYGLTAHESALLVDMPVVPPSFPVLTPEVLERNLSGDPTYGTQPPSNT